MYVWGVSVICSLIMSTEKYLPGRTYIFMTGQSFANDFTHFHFTQHAICTIYVCIRHLYTRPQGIDIITPEVK